ncbi:hypothetical protein [Variovorax sp. PAMC26660]|nr:hypothetical protein [Variovorax sp. PAMC26660]
MKKLWLALLFLTGGIAHEIRNPVNCQCISARQTDGPRVRTRKPS